MNSPTRKTRSDSKLDNLPPNQKEALERWLFDEVPVLSCAAACERLHNDFNVQSSETAVRSFYKRARQLRLENEALENAALDARSANRLMEQSETTAVNFSQAVLKLTYGEALKRAMRGEALTVEEMATIANMAAAELKGVREDKKIALQAANLEFNRAKWAEEKKEDIDKGLDALMAEAKGNKEALELFQKFRAVVKRAMTVK